MENKNPVARMCNLKLKKTLKRDGHFVSTTMKKAVTIYTVVTP